MSEQEFKPFAVMCDPAKPLDWVTVVPPGEPFPVRCPTDGNELERGYGLAGGGIGFYAYCPACDFFAKREDQE